MFLSIWSDQDHTPVKGRWTATLFILLNAAPDSNKMTPNIHATVPTTTLTKEATTTATSARLRCKPGMPLATYHYKYHINAEIRDLHGNLMFKIVDNKWQVFRMAVRKFNYDDNGFEVYDKDNRIAITLNFITGSAQYIFFKGIIPCTRISLGFYSTVSMTLSNRCSGILAKTGSTPGSDSSKDRGLRFTLQCDHCHFRPHTDPSL